MESVRHENNVQNGFVYLEHWSSEVTLSKAGQQMAKIKWSAVDRFGNIGSVYDYIGSSEKTQFKVNNLDNALGVKDMSIYDAVRGQFNLHLLRKVRCCAVVERDEYGPKIKKYVPIEFCNLVPDQNEDKGFSETNVNDNNFVYPDMKQEPNVQLVSGSDDDDDIPF